MEWVNNGMGGIVKRYIIFFSFINNSQYTSDIVPECIAA